ncbi:hypothetical protein GCM10023336_11350 [Streptomyces similanensis]|uniref:Uncharacterized protein n=1 Tax=Streptomyces similanensis TaxID=1274988 RepID=A0ABP9JWZ6_9ACTN
MSPGFAAFTAFWIDWPACTRRTFGTEIGGAAATPEPTSAAALRSKAMWRFVIFCTL